MMLRELTHRTAFRVAVIFAALFLVTVGAIFAVLYNLISSEIEAKLKSHILEVRNTLVDVSDREGLGELKTVLSNKRAPAPDDEQIYVLTDKSGQFLSGNIKELPRFEGWKRLDWETLRFKSTAEEYEGTDAVLATWTPVEGGFLLVGDGDSDVEETQDLLIDGFWWGLAISLSSALLGGTWLGLGAQRRINRLESALSAVAQGELGTRVPLTSSVDDLEHVALLINTMLDHLQDAVTSLSQVSTDIAHDLKTPIGRISQRLDLVSRSGTTIDAYREAVDDVRDDLDGVVATFEALLRIAQIEGGARKSRFAPVDLCEILSRLVEAYGYVGEDTNHRITAEVPEGGQVFVTGDKELLTQLFANLIENALRHCPPGSDIKVSLRSASGSLLACVSDNGPGIPETERERVFRRLYRLQKSRTTPGSGLGLSLVAAVAKLHDIQIELGDNRPGLSVELKFPNRV